MKKQILSLSVLIPLSSLVPWLIGSVVNSKEVVVIREKAPDFRGDITKVNGEEWHSTNRFECNASKSATLDNGIPVPFGESWILVSSDPPVKDMVFLFSTEKCLETNGTVLNGPGVLFLKPNDCDGTRVLSRKLVFKAVSW